MSIADMFDNEAPTIILRGSRRSARRNAETWICRVAIAAIAVFAAILAEPVLVANLAPQAGLAQMGAASDDDTAQIEDMAEHTGIRVIPIYHTEENSPQG
jgi:hypothetical protein